MPFRRNPSRESHLVAGLERFAEAEKRFEISLSGFDCFSPRVIFIKVTDHQPVIALHHRLNLVLKEELHFTEKELRENIHPHMTIATRDLSPDNFANAWPEFRERPFDGAFTARGITLLKHNGKFWDVFKEFTFPNSV